VNFARKSFAELVKNCHKVFVIAFVSFVLSGNRRIMFVDKGAIFAETISTI
jgi:hypothetical protein